MTCTHCKTNNTLDSLFCKSCGREISEQMRELARDENMKLLSRGYELLSLGRNEEAELIAKSVIEIDPNAAGAYSLLGMFYEREGEMVLALEAYERVVELNPDSALDKIKVTQVRNVITRLAQEPAPVNRKRALVGAACAILVVACTGAAIAIANSPKDNAGTKVASNGSGVLLNESFNGAPKAAAGTGGTLPTEQQSDPNAEQRDPNGNRIMDPPNTRNNQTYSGPRVDPNPNIGLPQVGSEEPKPLDRDFRPVTIAPPSNPPTQDKQEDPPPDLDNTSKTTTEPDPRDQYKGITITSSKKQPTSTGSGGAFIDPDPDKGGNGLTAVVKSANDQMMARKFDSAAKSLERAIQMGGDRGKLNQKLGICYEQSGKKSEAISAYRSAKSHLESKAATDPKAKSQLDSINQALKNLGG